ncbi:F5/8 type C domain-containing protein [Allonocardiopsis opalescens]|uniref:F5/8 type C domain-containing protein n=2 Tax=Allonocardiopsis opalescens TaxID=1144618 RepID=A0A2T0Q2R4_9ACTN|nr:F5/8 type C domain-containing protein [Allonocardiopsis opalescens]
MVTIAAVGVLAAGTVAGAPVLAAPGPAAQAPAAAQECEYPADVLDLDSWKIQLPIGEEESPDEVEQPELASYAVDPWFTVAENCEGVRFRAAVDGVTTSGSNYPRSELREMDGDDEASWAADEGRHVMTIDQTVTRLPNDRPHLVVGQIHGGDDDVSVFRIEGSNLYVTDGDDSNHQLVTDDFRLNTRFQVRFVVEDGTIHAYYNGEEVATLDADFTTGYFKAGAYTQANCGNSDPCDEDNYGEVIIHDVTIGEDAGTPPDQDPPAGDELEVSEVTASGDDGNEPENTLDGDLGTRWSDEGDGVWIEYDLGSVRQVGSVGLAWHRGDTRRHDFEIRTSDDGTDWTTRYEGSSGGETLREEVYALGEPADARYVRIVGSGNTDNDWTSITETRILGGQD